MPRPKKRDPLQEQMLAFLPYLDAKAIADVLALSPDIDAFLPSTEQETKYPTDPVEFMTQTLGYAMWPKLEEICRSVEQNKNTVVASGFGCGKSIVAAAMAMWWMTAHKPAVVITLAPSFSQVQNVLWRYMRSAGRKAELPGTIFDTPRWEVTPNHYAVGLSPRKSSAEDVTTIQGLHGPSELVIVDEAAGMPKLIWDAVAGLVVGDDCRMLAIGNPIEQAGPFWDACNSQSWHHIRISCFEHPNVVEGREVIPGAVTRGWIEERITDGWATEVEAGTPEAVEVPWLGKWFLPQSIFMAKVQGIAPPQAEDQLIHLAWVVEAQNRVIEDRHAEVVLGLDPAPRGGDDNALCTRFGQSVRSVKRLKGQDTQVMAEWLAMTIRETGAIKAYVEDMGSGAGTVDKARAMGLPVIAVNTSRSARQKKRFSNLRAECWWIVRELLREGKISLPANDHLLAGDLVAPKYKPDNYGRILIEDKEEIRGRLGRSPDSGDSLAITYAQPVVEIDDGIVAGARELAQGQDGGTASRWVVEGRRGVSRWRR